MTVTLKGLFPSVVLPLREDLSFAHRNYIVQIQGFARMPLVGGVIVNDEVGEITALAAEERARVVAVAYEAAPDGFPIIAGVRADTHEEAARLGNDAKEHGATALLVLPGSDGIDSPVEFHRELAASTGLPLVAYQGAATSGVRYDIDTLTKICDIAGVIGLKTAIDDVAVYREQYNAVREKVAVLVANEGSNLVETLAAGASGASLDVSNVLPKPWSIMVDNAIRGEVDAAREWFDSLGAKLIDTLRNGGKTAALTKTALMMSAFLPNNLVRPPATAVDDTDSAAVAELLGSAGLLPG